MAKLKTPYFCRGSRKNLEYALSDGIFKDLDRALWCYVTTGAEAGQLLLVHKDKTIHPVVGNNKQQVVRCQTLPDVENGDTETLYLVDASVYSFDGIKYIPIVSSSSDSYSKDEIDQKLAKVEEYVDDHVGAATWYEV